MTVWIPTASLASEIHCVFCGYNLRGLDPAGRCPECGQPIAASNRGDQLAHADPTWLRKLRFGASLKLWNIVLTILLGMTAGFVVGLMGLPTIVAVLVGWLGALLGLWATFCITTQEPRTSLTEDPVSLRNFIRICAILAFLGGIIHALADVITISDLGEFLYFFLSLIATLAGVIVVVVELVYFRRFALRAPDVALARSTRTLIWGLGITWGLTTVGGVIFAAVMSSGAAAAAGPVVTTQGGVNVSVTTTTTVTTPIGTTTTGAALPFAALGVGVCAVSVLAGVFFIWYVVLLVRYRRLFASAISEGSLAGAISNENI